MKSLTQICWRDGDIISPGGVLKAWAEWIRVCGSPEKELQAAKDDLAAAELFLEKAADAKATGKARAFRDVAMHSVVRAELALANRKMFGWPSSSIEWRLMFSTRGGSDLTAPESAVENLKHAAYLGEWCAGIIADCTYVQRRAVRHRYVDGMTNADIAMQLGGRPVEGVEPMAADEVQDAISAAQERLRRAIKAVVSSLKMAA